MGARRTGASNQILNLAAFTGGRLYPCGTAFLIGPNLAMTATHVLDQPFDQRLVDTRRLRDDSVSIAAFQVVNRGAQPLQWSIRTMSSIPSAEKDETLIDVSVLTLAPYGDPLPEIEDYRRWFFALNVAPPRVGDPVVAYGFANTEVTPNPDDAFEHTFSHRFRKIRATVTAVYFPMRDVGGMPFPCFEVDAEFEPGMSGGPVFNERDEVCGVVSRGSEFGVSWACSLWPAFGIPVDGGSTLYEIARAGHLRVRNLRCVRVFRKDGYDFPHVEFDPNLVV